MSRDIDRFHNSFVSCIKLYNSVISCVIEFHQTYGVESLQKLFLLVSFCVYWEKKVQEKGSSSEMICDCGEAVKAADHIKSWNLDPKCWNKVFLMLSLSSSEGCSGELHATLPEMEFGQRRGECHLPSFYLECREAGTQISPKRPLRFGANDIASYRYECCCLGA